MPTAGAGINGASIIYEIIATDKVRNYSTTILNSFSIGFEMNNADKRYLETTSIKSFGVEFEYNILYIDEIIFKQI